MSGEQLKEDKGFTTVRCVHCRKYFKFINADPEYVESMAFCSEACRNVHYWYVGRAKFLEFMKTGSKNVYTQQSS